MKIAYIVPALVMKAPVLVVLNIASKMANDGHAVDIFYFDKNVELSIPENINCKQLRFFNKIDFRKFDIVHSNMLRPDLYVFLFKPLFTTTKCISTIHNYVYEDLKNNYGILYSIIFTLAWNIIWIRHDRLVVLSRHAVKYYRRILLNRRIRYIYNGISDIKYNDLLPLDYIMKIHEFKKGKKIIIGTYCVVGKIKNLKVAIKYLNSNLSCGFILIGDGLEKRNLIDYARKINVFNNCLFLPAVKNAHQLNKYIDVFIQTSKAEGFGLSLVEASLYTKNIVCSNIPIFRELFDETQVTYFDLNSDESFINAINISLLTSNYKPDNARCKTEKSYMLHNMYSNYLKLYNYLIDNKNIL